MSSLSDAVRVERDGPVYTVLLSRARSGATPSTAPPRPRWRTRSGSSTPTPTPRSAVLHGEGGVFCAGADLKAVGTAAGNRVAADGDGPMGPTRMRLSKPVIAAVAGHAVAGGLELALWCDLRVAEEDAVFGVFCRRWGVPLIDGGTVRLPRLIGVSRAMDMILTGRPVDAPEALQIGPGQPRRRRRAEPRRGRGAGSRAGGASRRPACARTGCRCSSRRALDETEAMADELEHGLRSLAEVQAGLERFRAGAGRHGSFEDA